MSNEPKQYGSSEWLIAGMILVIGIPLALWYVNRDRSGKPEIDTTQQDFIWIERGKDVVREKLKDPSSAVFRDTNVRRQTGAPVVCGEVNAANSYGGKGGFQRFVFMGSKLGVLLEEELSPTDFASLWDRTCKY